MEHVSKESVRTKEKMANTKARSHSAVKRTAQGLDILLHESVVHVLQGALHDCAGRAVICQGPSRGWGTGPPFTGVSNGEQIWPLSRSGEACGELFVEDPYGRARSGRGTVNPVVRGKGRQVDSRAGPGPEAATGWAMGARVRAATGPAPRPGPEASTGWGTGARARAAPVPDPPPWTKSAPMLAH
jgi:hypothetical protein